MNTKRCTKCLVEKDLSEFYISKQFPDDHLYFCKTCVRKYRREYHARPDIRERYHRYYKDYQAEYRKTPKYKELQTKWKKKFRASHPHEIWAEGSLGCHRHKGIIVSVSYKELASLAKKVSFCPICGIKLRWTQGRGEKLSVANNSPTVDRINNEAEMNLDNIQIICYSCNTTKLHRTMSEFVSYCKMVADKFYKETPK